MPNKKPNHSPESIERRRKYNSERAKLPKRREQLRKHSKKYREEHPEKCIIYNKNYIKKRKLGVIKQYIDSSVCKECKALGNLCSEKCVTDFTSRRNAASYKKQGESLHKYWIEINKTKPFDELSADCQKVRLIEEQENKCAHCGMEFIWFGKILPCHLHHKDGNHINKTRNNCELTCPNCHSLTDNWGFRNRHHSETSKNKISLNSKVVEVWKKKKNNVGQ